MPKKNGKQKPEAMHEKVASRNLSMLKTHCYSSATNLTKTRAWEINYRQVRTMSGAFKEKWYILRALTAHGNTTQDGGSTLDHPREVSYFVRL